MVLVACDICGSLVSRKSLSKHRSSIHKSTIPPRKTYLHDCTYCSDKENAEKFRTTSQYIAHLNEAHPNELKSQITVENRIFRCLSDLEFFKNQVQEKELTQFSLRSSKGDNFFYRCNRFAHPNRPLGIPPEKRKRQCLRGQTRVTSSCPVYLNARVEPNGTITARYCLQHVGHSLEMDHLSLTEKSKGNIKRSEIEKTMQDLLNNDLYKNGSANILENFKNSLQDIVKAFLEESQHDLDKKSNRSERKRAKSDKPTGIRKKVLT